MTVLDCIYDSLLTALYSTFADATRLRFPSFDSSVDILHKYVKIKHCLRCIYYTASHTAKPITYTPWLCRATCSV